MEVTTQCPICKTVTVVIVPRQGYELWKEGTLIQDAMPNILAGDRERLISGICPKCWEGLDER